MSAYPDRPTLRVDSPAELLAAVPYMLGYHPTTSIVTVALANRRLLTVARLDLPATDDEMPQLREAARGVADMVTSHGASAAVLIGYGPDKLVRPSVQTLTDALTPQSVRVLDALRVDDGRYWSYRCDNPACCPPEGTHFDPTVTAAAATATAAGMVALPDRAALAARLTPVTDAARTRMVQATGAATQVVLNLVETIAPAHADRDLTPTTPLGHALLAAGLRHLITSQHSYHSGTPIDDQRAALLTVLLTLPSVRAAAAQRTTGQPWEIDMWIDLVRRAEPDFTASPATLLALAALQAGDGTLANLAVERAMNADPNDTFANLLAAAVAYGIDPATVAALLAG